MNYSAANKGKLHRADRLLRNARPLIATMFLPVSVLLARSTALAADPVLLGEWKPDGFGNASNLDISGKLVALANFSGLLLIDVSDPARPMRMAQIPTGKPVLDVRVVGHLAYTASTTAGLQIVDISDPAKPTLSGNFTPQGAAVSIHLAGHYAYMAADYAGLQIVDVSDPENPLGVGGLITAFANDVDVAGNVAYLADRSEGVIIIDVSDPATPTEMGRFKTVGQAMGLQLIWPLLYVAEGASGLSILDVTDATHPVSLGGFNTTGNANAVAVVGNVAFVADGTSGVQVIDVSDPRNPVRTGGKKLNTEAIGIRVEGQYAYVGKGPGGLQVLDVSQAVAPSLGITRTAQGADLLLFGATGRAYALESTTVLAPAASWSVATNVVLTTNQLSLPNFSTSTVENRFFRVRLVAQ